MKQMAWNWICFVVFGFCLLNFTSCKIGQSKPTLPPQEKDTGNRTQDTEEKIDPKLENKIYDLISELGADDPDARDKAQEELTEIGLPAKKYLEYTVRHTKDVERRYRAKEILKIIPILERVDKKDRKTAIQIVKKILDETDYRKRFEMILEIKDKKELTEEVKTLIAKEAFPKEFLQGIESEKDKVYIINIIRNQKLKFASCVLAGLLEDGDVGVRNSAVWVLGELSAKEYVKDIVKLLEDKDTYVRSHAVWALVKLSAKEVLPELKKQLEKEKDNEVRSAIEDAIKKIESEK